VSSALKDTVILQNPDSTKAFQFTVLMCEMLPASSGTSACREKSHSIGKATFVVVSIINYTIIYIIIQSISDEIYTDKLYTFNNTRYSNTKTLMKVKRID